MMLWIKKLIRDDMIIWGFRMFQNYFKQVRKDIFTGVSLNISVPNGSYPLYSVHTAVAQGIDYGDKPFRKP